MQVHSMATNVTNNTFPWFIILLYINIGQVHAITPVFTIDREISFGVVLPEPGACRMIAKTGVIIDYQSNNICIMQDNAQNGLYTITANPNKNIRVKFPPNLDNGDGVVFNPYVEMNSDGQTPQTIFNNTGFVIINSGVTGVVNLYLGGDLIVSRSYPYNQKITFSFIDVIEWQEDP
jgi:hypothetical protein